MNTQTANHINDLYNRAAALAQEIGMKNVTHKKIAKGIHLLNTKLDGMAFKLAYSASTEETQKLNEIRQRMMRKRENLWMLSHGNYPL